MSTRAARICDCSDHGFVRLSKWHTALFDPADIHIISGKTWTVETKSGRAYALSTRGPKSARVRTYMHRAIVSASDFSDIDHRNGDGTDNRRANLRIASRSQNNANQRPRGGASRFKGVHFHKQTGKWHAQIRAYGRRRSLGLFSSEIEAARAYDAAATAEFGEFAATNETLGLLESHP